MMGFSRKQEWRLVFSTLRNSKAGLLNHYVDAFDIQKALTKAKEDLPRDAQIVRIELSIDQRG